MLIEVKTAAVTPSMRRMAIGKAMPVHFPSAVGLMQWQHPRGGRRAPGAETPLTACSSPQQPSSRLWTTSPGGQSGFAVGIVDIGLELGEEEEVSGEEGIGERRDSVVA